MKNKENKVDKLFQLEIDKIIWVYERIDNKLYLHIGNDKTISDIFEIVLLSLKNDYLKKEDDFWNIKITDIDKETCVPINYIYYLTGGDKIWKYNKLEIWTEDWQYMSRIFSEFFDAKILNILNKCKKLKDLRNKILNSSITSEDFYEFGLKSNKIKNGN